jgi:hypothetical protein
MQVEVLEDRQLLATITVNATADDSTADATLSLREAIEVSNGTLAVSSLSTQEQAQVSGTVGNTNTIDFNIPTTDPGYDPATGVWTIAPSTELPAISTNAAIIDGYSQPGSSENTLAHGDNAKLTIAISGGVFAQFNGLTIGQQGSQISGLDIGNFDNGVVITAGGNVQVAGCFIGADPTGEKYASNAWGVVIENSFNTIGGPSVGDRNVISGNLQDTGIFVPYQAVNPLGITPTGNLIENNFIGLDATGTKALGNGYYGVSDNGSGDIYGGTAAGVGNVISGNGEYGIAASGNITIEGNYVGTDATGNVAVGNGPTYSGGTGIYCAEALNAKSVTAVISNNVVSGNSDGIRVFTNVGSQSAYTIADNLIGTNAAGTAGVGNKGIALDLHSVENATVQNNVISANYDGVELETSAPLTELQHVVFLGNLIGTDKTGTVALGNTTGGITIDPGSGITIGGPGPGQGNVIANNIYGISLLRGQQDQFIRNSIFGNIGYSYIPAGITVGTGANQSVTPPALTFTPGTGTTGMLSGTLTGSPNLTYVIEVFSNPTVPSAGQEQGKTFIQDVMVKTNGSGQGTFSVTLPVGIYTATATDPNGNTSAFSNATGSQALPASVTAVASSSNPSLVGQQVTFTAVVTAAGYSGTPTGTVTFTIDGAAQTPVPLSVIGGANEAQFTTSALTAGQHSVTATYSGDAHVSGSSASLPSQTVNAANWQPTTTMLTSSVNPSTVGQQVTFTAVVSPEGHAGVPTGSVIFTIDGKPQSPVALHQVGGRDRATFSIASLTAGTHTISATYDGDGTFASSTGVTPLSQVVERAAGDPPTVELVQRFGVHMQPTVLVLTFSTALDPASAQDPLNYVVEGPTGRRVAIRTAVYDPAAHTVTLRPHGRISIHHPYHFTVIGKGAGAVTGADGTPLDGQSNGDPGSNYVTTLTWRNLVLTPAEIQKYDSPRGAHPAGALHHRFVSRAQ